MKKLLSAIMLTLLQVVLFIVLHEVVFDRLFSSHLYNGRGVAFGITFLYFVYAFVVVASVFNLLYYFMDWPKWTNYILTGFLIFLLFLVVSFDVRASTCFIALSVVLSILLTHILETLTTIIICKKKQL